MFRSLFSCCKVCILFSSQNLDKVYPIEVFIRKEPLGLDKDSKVLLNQIRAIDKRRLVKRLGQVDNETMIKIDEALKISLDL